MKPSTYAAAVAGLIAALCMQGRALADDIQATCDTIAPGQATLHVKVSGMRSGNGNVTITIYPDDAAHFLDGKFKLARQKVPVTLPVTTACFALPAPGAYAVALFHDENDDGHLNTNTLGIPTEGAGFSNNPTLYFGPPSLEKVRFPLHPGDNSLDVRVKYY
ncbi:MAG TPA: DUF2141 domain-containing protein [Alphaproteobacteria bacterium]|nr:DUF2141 domain-containing protein [Alphaproteobacteria bacterium]